MKRFARFILIALISFGFLFGGNVSAGEWLGKKEVTDLVAGNTIKGFYMMQNESVLTRAVLLKLKFFTDGKAEKTTIPAKGSKGTVVENGSWTVNKKGKLCMIWDNEGKKKCGRMKRAADGTYELIRKNQKFVYEEIIPGT